VIAVILFAMVACSRQTDRSNGATGGEADSKILNVYSWLDYIAPDTVANFAKETGAVLSSLR
jgi:spermidine/putrescine-binding protein